MAQKKEQMASAAQSPSKSSQPGGGQAAIEGQVLAPGSSSDPLEPHIQAAVDAIEGLSADEVAALYLIATGRWFDKTEAEKAAALGWGYKRFRQATSGPNFNRALQQAITNAVNQALPAIMAASLKVATTATASATPERRMLFEMMGFRAEVASKKANDFIAGFREATMRAEEAAAKAKASPSAPAQFQQEGPAAPAFNPQDVDLDDGLTDTKH